MDKIYIAGTDFPCEEGISVKKAVLEKLGLSVRSLKTLKYNGEISVNDKKVNVNYMLKRGDVLKLSFPKEASDIESEDVELDVIYEDDDYLCVNKPSGMPVHPSYKHRTGTLAGAVMNYYNGDFVFRVLTRLDADTTGVVVIAKNAQAAAYFQKANPQKIYFAICEGSPAEKCGRITVPIARAKDSIIKRVTDENGKESVTEYEVVEEKNGLSMIKAVAVTGRTHQIRLHMSYIGCPVYADFLYGNEIEGERTRLHCKTVSFKGKDGEMITVEAKIPDDFDFFNKLS